MDGPPDFYRRYPIWGLLTLLFLVACGGTAVETAVINLAKLEPLPTSVLTDVPPLKVAVAAVISPQGNVATYSPLLAYLGQQLDRPVELVQRRTYAEVNELIRRGEVDIAFVCTSAYVAGAREFGLLLLVAPQVDEETIYRSLLIVPADSAAREMADLEGGVFAFTDPMSTSGRNYPTYLVRQLGSSPERFFQRTFFTYSHDDAIRAVANGLADGAAVDSLVYAHAVAADPDLLARTRVIHHSPPFAIPPVVAGTHVPEQTRTAVANILLRMNGDTSGRSALAVAGIDRFVLIGDEAYDSIRALESLLAELP